MGGCMGVYLEQRSDPRPDPLGSPQRARRNSGTDRESSSDALRCRSGGHPRERPSDSNVPLLAPWPLPTTAWGALPQTLAGASRAAPQDSPTIMRLAEATLPLAMPSTACPRGGGGLPHPPLGCALSSGGGGGWLTVKDTVVPVPHILQRRVQCSLQQRGLCCGWPSELDNQHKALIRVLNAVPHPQLVDCVFYLDTPIFRVRFPIFCCGSPVRPFRMPPGTPGGTAGMHSAKQGLSRMPWHPSLNSGCDPSCRRQSNWSSSSSQRTSALTVHPPHITTRRPCKPQ